MPTQSSARRHTGLCLFLLIEALLAAGAFMLLKTDKGRELLPTLKNATMRVGNITPGELRARLPVAGPQQIPVEVSKHVYIPKMPKIEVANVDVQHLGLKNGQAIETLTVTNHNPFPFTIRQVKYDFRVGDYMAVQGVRGKDVVFRTKGTELLPIRAKFEPKGVS